MDNQYLNPVPSVAPKKSNKVVIGLVIAIAVLILALGGVACFAVYNMFFNSPEARLAKGLAKWSETQENENSVSEVLGWEEISDSMIHGATFKDLSLNMTFPSLGVPTIGLDMVDTCDYPNQKDLSDWKVSISNIELLSFQIAADADKLYISIPTLLKDTYHMGFEGYTEAFNNSAWSRMLEITLEESIDINPWATEEKGDAEEVDQELIFSEEFMDTFETKMEEIAKNMTVEVNDLTFKMIRNSKTIPCDEIGVVVSKDDINAIMDLIQEELRSGKLGAEMIKSLQVNGITNAQEVWEQVVVLFDCRFVEDLEVYFYLDKKNNILQMSTGRIAIDNGVMAGLFLEYMGEEAPASIIGGSYAVKVEDEGEILVNFSNEFTTEGSKEFTSVKMDFEMREDGLEPVETSVDLAYSWDNETYDFTISMDVDEMEESVLGFVLEGKFADVVKGESFSLELGNCIVNLEGVNYMKLTGNFDVAPLTEEVKIPTESVDLFGMTEMDIQMMLFEFIGKAGNMTEALNELNF